MSTEQGRGPVIERSSVFSAGIWLVVVLALGFLAVRGLGILSLPDSPSEAALAAVSTTAEPESAGIGNGVAEEQSASPAVEIAESRIVESKDAEAEVMQRVASAANGSCLSAGDAFFAQPQDLGERLDRQYRAANLDGEGWLPADKSDWWFSSPNRVWAGGLEGLGAELGATAVYVSGDVAWAYLAKELEGGGESEPSAQGLRRFESKSGGEFWALGGGIAPAGCDLTDE